MKKDYTKYDPLQFAQDDWFIKWVKSGHLDNNEFWEKWLIQNPDKANDVATAKKLVQAIRTKTSTQNPQQINDLWKRIETNISTDQKAPTKITRLKAIKWVSAAAAACITFFLVFYFLGPSSTTVSAPYGEFATETLPDGSSVQLNAGSNIVFDAKNWNKKRSVALNGEAFFEVKKGEQFTVVTPLGTVTVLGTSFNVLARNNDFEVTCFTGKVSVKKSDSSERILNSGQYTKAFNGADLSEVNNTDLNKKAGWRQGSFYYVDYPIVKVFKEIERQFDVTIKAAPNINNIEGNFIFETNNLDSALQKICWPSRLQYEINGNTVVIGK